MILALRTRCTRARNAKAPTRRARKHGEHNSDFAEAEPQRNFVIKDVEGDVVS